MKEAKVCSNYGIYQYQSYYMCSAFGKTRILLELRRVLSCESLGHVFLHTPIEEKGPWGPFYQLREGASKRETSTSNLSESTVCVTKIIVSTQNA